MERLFFIKLGYVEVVNNFLKSVDGRIKSIHPISKNVAAYGYAGGETFDSQHGCFDGDIYAYVVVEWDDENSKYEPKKSNYVEDDDIPDGVYIGK